MKKLELINLTPHTVNLIDGDGKTFTILPSGIIPRLTEEKESLGTINGFPVVKKSFGEVENLPEPKEGTIYIVSALVAGAVNRDDLVVPDGLVRNDKGQIIGCSGFARV